MIVVTQEECPYCHATETREGYFCCDAARDVRGEKMARVRAESDAREASGLRAYIAALEAGLDQWQSLTADAAGRCAEKDGRIAVLEKQVALLREALGPFVVHTNLLGLHEAYNTSGFTISDMARARAAWRASCPAEKSFPPQ